MAANPILEMLNQKQQTPTNNQQPNMKMVQDYISQHGGNARDAFFSLAKEKGIDPSFILNMLRGQK